MLVPDIFKSRFWFPRNERQAQRHAKRASDDDAAGSGGYSCTRAAASLGAWDVIGIGAADVVLVQVKTRDWPGATEMETLRLFRAPANAHKLVHRWRDGMRMPDVKEL